MRRSTPHAVTSVSSCCDRVTQLYDHPTATANAMDAGGDMARRATRTPEAATRLLQTT